MSPPFRRRGDRVAVSIGRRERAVVAQVPRLLATVGDPGQDPAADRLFPPVHPDDPDADRRFRDMIDASLDEAREDDRGILLQTLDREPLRLTMEEAEAWLRVIGEGRLVLGARLGIVADGWERDDLGESPEAALFGYLSWLQDGLVVALLSGMSVD